MLIMQAYLQFNDRHGDVCGAKQLPLQDPIDISLAKFYQTYIASTTPKETASTDTTTQNACTKAATKLVLAQKDANADVSTAWTNLLTDLFSKGNVFTTNSQ